MDSQSLLVLKSPWARASSPPGFGHLWSLDALTPVSPVSAGACSLTQVPGIRKQTQGINESFSAFPAMANGGSNDLASINYVSSGIGS